METTKTSGLESFESLTLSNNAITYLTETHKWGKFLSILGFIAVGFMIIAGLVISFSFSDMPAGDLPFSGGLLGVFYIVLAILYLFPSLYLFRFSKNLKKSFATKNSQSLEEGFKNLKSHYKFIGVFAIIMLVIYGFVFVGALITGLLANGF